MYKLLVLTALVAAVSAAPYYGAPLASPYYGAAVAPWGHGVVGGPVFGAPVVKAAVPVATSYANTVRVATPTVVAAHAPYGSPYASPYAHAPLVASPYAHAW